MTTVSMIDVARHFAEYVDLVVNRGERFTLTRDGMPVAELGPVLTPVRLEDLSTFLASLPCLTPAGGGATTGDWDARTGGTQRDGDPESLGILTCTGESDE
jgi:antitoxin (DNA-binding transcriptional repressor) of toxin-antitoxin stability system